MGRLMVLCFVVLSFSVMGQTSEKYNSVYANFYKAEELFQKQQYGSARKEFRDFINSFNQPNDPMYIKAMYYEGMAAIELYNNDGVDLLKQFMQKYPETIYKTPINFKLGNYYYRAKDYKEAIVYYDRFKATDLQAEDRDEYYFKVGYSYFQLENFSAARSAFVEVKDGESQYATPSLYYFSHISYYEKNYQTAMEGFLKLENDAGFGKVVPYYIIQIYYLQGKYEKVTEYAPKLDNATIVNEKDINHLIGDAYYQVGKYDEAVPFLEKYDKLANTSRDEDYQLGYTYYKSGSFDKAIKVFDRVVKDEKDSLSQVALYHIGECYLAMKNNFSARSAFQKASEIDKDLKLQEDALYQFAVLSYKLDVNPYNEAIIAFETYLNNYPSSKRKEDIYQYLVNVYTSTNNYQKAIESLDRVNNKDITLQKAYQLIAYNYGVELYQKEKFQASIDAFGLVSKYPINSNLLAKAVYWIADANYQLNNYQQSLSGYRSFLGMIGTTSEEMKSDAYYNMGYANLYKGDTVAAIENFRTYEQRKPLNKQKLADAYMRLADSYFMRKENKTAIKYYDLAIQTNVSQQDQALYYKALTLGVENDKQGKIKALLDIVNNYSRSKYLQDALYEIAFTYKLVPDYEKSLTYFRQLLNDYPNPKKEPGIRIEIADIYYKLNNYKKSEEEYLLVLEKYGYDTICNAVGDGLQNVYAATKQVNKLEEYAKKYPCLNINEMTLENLVYNPAETSYFAKEYADAATKFETYLSKYPQGYHSKKAKYYLADSYYELDNLPKSIEIYDQLLKEPTSNYTELAAVRAARYYFNNGNYAVAIPYYERTVQVSTDPEIVFNAETGLMRSYFQTQDFEPAAASAKIVVKSNLLKTESKLEAQYILGVASYSIKDYAEALTALSFVSRNTTKAIASESQFLIASIYFEQDNLKDADKNAKDVLKMKPTYDYWIAKSLILQTKILMKKDDLFQAEQTIRSVIEQYPEDNDGIKEEAQHVYDELMQIKNMSKDVAPTEATEVEINGGN
ncbi:MAG: tetratricopeptide repeat protein [Crocinitomicaceae bacterium]|nr:tetratricopeptide repeat protein [Crocinitomicaceae bacterium]